MRIIIAILAIQLISFMAYSQDFEVSPVRLFFNAEPGSSQVKTIVVKNHSNSTNSFLLSVSDFDLKSEGQREYAPANSHKRSISNWMTISPTFLR